MHLHFIAPLPAIRKRTRLVKMVRHFILRGFQVQFHGWERQSGEAQSLCWEEPGLQELTILKGGGYASGRARAMYPLWMLAVFFRVLWLGRHQTLFCLGWETAFPALLAARFTQSVIVFDDADRFSMILKLPRPFSSVLQYLERWTSRHVLLHIVPSFSRYEWRNPNMVPLRNTPLRKDFEAAAATPKDSFEHSLTVYANGWLGETRGAPEFLDLANRLEASGASVRFLIAGRVDSPAGEALIQHPLVIFYGEVDQTRALALYRHADVVLTYYDPKVPINRKAESNKWGDCVYFGIPFIVNSEVETANPFVEMQAAFAVPYKDTEGLFRLIYKWTDDLSPLKHASTQLELFRSDYPVFDDQLDHILQRIQENPNAINQ